MYHITYTKHPNTTPYSHSWITTHNKCADAGAKVESFCMEMFAITKTATPLAITYTDGRTRDTYPLISPSDIIELAVAYKESIRIGATPNPVIFYNHLSNKVSLKDIVFKHKELIDTGNTLTVTIEFYDHLAKEVLPIYTLKISNQSAVQAKKMEHYYKQPVQENDHMDEAF
jgi:hypothetical protein